MTEQNTPAGWYPDPENPGSQRYWDGQTWTEHRAPAQSGDPASASLAQSGEQSPKKPIYKKWWVWAIAIVLAIGVLGNLGDGPATVTEEPEEPAVESVVDTEPELEPEPVPAEPVADPEPEPEPEPELTMGQRQAVGTAQDYLNYKAFSRKGLIDQLVFEGFSNDDSTFAVDYIEPDWNAQAAQAAQDYLDYTSFSRQGLIDQLVFEGYTKEQAEYGVTEVGY